MMTHILSLQRIMSNWAICEASDLQFQLLEQWLRRRLFVLRYNPWRFMCTFSWWQNSTWQSIWFYKFFCFHLVDDECSLSLGQNPRTSSSTLRWGAALRERVRSADGCPRTTGMWPQEAAVALRYRVQHSSRETLGGAESHGNGRGRGKSKKQISSRVGPVRKQRDLGFQKPLSQMN